VNMWCAHTRKPSTPIAAVEYATALFPADPLVFDSLAGLGRGARGF